MLQIHIIAQCFRCVHTTYILYVRITSWVLSVHDNSLQRIYCSTVLCIPYAESPPFRTSNKIKKRRCLKNVGISINISFISSFWQCACIDDKDLNGIWNCGCGGEPFVSSTTQKWDEERRRMVWKKNPSEILNHVLLQFYVRAMALCVNVSSDRTHDKLFLSSYTFTLRAAWCEHESVCCGTESVCVWGDIHESFRCCGEVLHFGGAMLHVLLLARGARKCRNVESAYRETYRYTTQRTAAIDYGGSTNIIMLDFPPRR